MECTVVFLENGTNAPKITTFRARFLQNGYNLLKMTEEKVS